MLMRRLFGGHRNSQHNDKNRSWRQRSQGACPRGHAEEREEEQNGKTCIFLPLQACSFCIRMFSSIINCLVWIKPSPFLKMRHNPPLWAKPFKWGSRSRNASCKPLCVFCAHCRHPASSSSQRFPRWMHPGITSETTDRHTDDGPACSCASGHQFGFQWNKLNTTLNCSYSEWLKHGAGSYGGVLLQVSACSNEVFFYHRCDLFEGQSLSFWKASKNNADCRRCCTNSVVLNWI